MNNGKGEQGINNAAHESGQQQAGGPPLLRPHLVVTRTITYRGDSQAVRSLLAMSLPEGLFLSGNGAFTIEVRAGGEQEDTPEWMGVVKAKLEAAQAEQEQAQGQRTSAILNPHTLRPVK